MSRSMVIVLAALFLASCASSPRAKRIEAVQKLQQDIEEIKTTKADKADTNVKIDDFKTELQIVSGKLDETEQLVRQTKAKQEQNSERLDQVIAEYDKKIVVLEEAISKLESRGVRSAQPAENIKFDYIEGYKRLQAKEFDEAIRLFSRYIQNFPAGRAIHNARFYLASAMFQKKDFETAILKYEEYKEKYPKGEKISEALYHQGVSFEQLGKKSDSKLFFQELISNHSQSPWAKKAQEALKKLK